MNHFGKSFTVSACAIATAAFLSACGGGDAGAPFSPTPLAGFAVDGYLNGASVKCDASGVVVKTDSSGFFRFPDGCSSSVTLTGGTSMDTLLPFAGQLKAPAGATVITPLTTLLADGVTLTDLNKALGLPAGTDLMNADPAYAPNGVLANEVLMKVTAALQLALQKTTELLVGLAGTTTAGDKQAIYNEVAAAAAAIVKGGSVTLVTGTGSSAALDQTVIASFVKAAALSVGQSSAVSTAVKTAVNGVNAESLGLVVAGGLKAQTEAILKSGTALTAVTLAQQNDTQIATFVATNKTALAGLPTTVTTLGTTLTGQVAGSGGGSTSSFAGIDFSATNIQFNPFGNLVTAAIANDPTNPSNKVAKFVKGPGGEVWAGATIYDKGAIVANSPNANIYVDAFDLSTSKIVTMRSYTDAPIGTPVTLKLENATNAGQNIQVAVNTTKQNAWETLSFDFATSGSFSGHYDPAVTYNTVSVLPAFNVNTTTTKPAADTTFYFDDLAYTKIGSSGGATGGTAPTTAPTTTIPSGAITIYSDAANVTGFDSCPSWGQTTVCGGEQTIAGNKVLKYSALTFQGLDWAGSPQNVSSKGKLHLDFWTPDLTSVKVSIISTGKESAYTQTLTTGSWNSVDIDLSNYTVPDKTAIIQIKLEATTPGTLYVDNIYFWGTAGGGSVSCGTTAPTCAPTTTIPSGALAIYSDAATLAGIDTAPVWGQNPPVVASEQTIASNKSLKYTFGALYQGIDWSGSPQDVSGKGTLHLDVWTADVASVKVSLIGGGSENGITKTLTAGAWTSIDIPLNQYTSPDLTKIIQMKLEPNAAGTIYVDNIYFYGTAAAGAGGATTFTGGIFASDYSGNLGANTAKSDKGGTIGFFFDPRLFAVKAYDFGGVAGSAADPAGIHNFYYGIAKPATPTYADAYFGGFVNAPGDTTADASAFAKVQMKFWGDAPSWEQSNFTAQVDVILQGPTNSACTNPSGRPEILKTVTAQKIGAGSLYVIPKTDFALTADCGGAYTINSVWSAVGSVVVRLTGSSNLNYANADAGSNPPVYQTAINIGPISFIN